jgi:hypothetical protein
MKLGRFRTELVGLNKNQFTFQLNFYQLTKIIMENGIIINEVIDHFRIRNINFITSEVIIK